METECDECGCALDKRATCGYHPDCGACSVRREDVAKQQAGQSHDHQAYCGGCKSMTDMEVGNVSCCSVCGEKFSGWY